MSLDQENVTMDHIEHHAKVISFINMKGGVGKTTLTKQLGYHLSTTGKKVLMIDVDPQMNLTQSMFEIFGYAPSAEIAEQVRAENHNDISAEVSKVSISSVFKGNSSSPATYANSVQPLKADHQLDIVPGELGVEFSLRNLNSNLLENGIFDFIKKNKLRDVYDYILLDCPPTYSSYTVAALKPSDYFLIPMRPEAYSILGVDMLLKVVHSVVSENDLYFENKPLKNLGVIFTNIEKTPSTTIQKMIKNIKKSKNFSKEKVYFFDNNFLHNPTIEKSLDYLIDTSNSDVKSKPNLEKLTTEFNERIDATWTNK